MAELVLLSVALFCSMAFTAWLSLTIQRRIQEPLLKEMRYMIRHISAHDLQVYHGVAMTDYQTAPNQRMNGLGSQAPTKSREELVIEAETIAREFDRFNGNLTATAET